LPSIGAEREIFPPTERLARYVAVEAGAQIERRAIGQARGIERNAKELRAAPIAPGVPMPDEQLVVQHAMGRRVGERIQTLLGAGEILAVDEHVHADQQAIALR
jgi:hypothetical protein